MWFFAGLFFSMAIVAAVTNNVVLFVAGIILATMAAIKA